MAETLFLQIQMLIFRPERLDRSAEKFSNIAERLFLIVCWKQAFLLKRANLKMHKVLCCQQWPRGLKARAVDSKAIACYDISTNYHTMLICGLLQINMPALSDARQGGKAGSGRGFSLAWTTLTCADNYNSWTAPRLPTMLIEPAHIQQTGATIQGNAGVFDQYGKYSEHWNRGLNMLNQFSRTQLLIRQEGMERLFNARVAVFGIGGVGGYTVEVLARSGIGTLDLIDDDRVCLINLNRQLLATRKTVGQYKVDVAEQRIHEINPDAVVHTYKTFYTPQTTEQFDFTRYDYVVDAIDTVTGKLELAEQAPKNRNAYRQQYGRREQDGCCRL